MGKKLLGEGKVGKMVPVKERAEDGKGKGRDKKRHVDLEKE